MRPVTSEACLQNQCESCSGCRRPRAQDKPFGSSQRDNPGDSTTARQFERRSVPPRSMAVRFALVTILSLAMSLPKAFGVERANQPGASPTPAADSAAYVACPVDAQAIDGGGSGVALACSESLMDPHEVSDIFGHRIANTYLVAEVKVRNLSDDYEFLLHDIRLGYHGVAVTSRDKRLVRGVAEKGQLLDARNVLIRGVESAGSLGGSLSTFGFASVGLKDALNVFQGPFTTALKGFLPDFTINQMNRLDDNAFTVQTMVVPKKSSVSVVVFLSRDVFLDPDEQKALRTSWTGKRGRDEGAVLFNIQQNLTVAVAGAHVSEVNTDEPVVSKIDPTSAAANATNTAVTLLGKNLDRVTKVRIGDGSSGAVEGTLQLVNLDPTWAKATIVNMPKQAGTYHIYLETPTGHYEDSNQVFTVTPQQLQ